MNLRQDSRSFTNRPLGEVTSPVFDNPYGRDHRSSPELDRYMSNVMEKSSAARKLLDRGDVRGALVVAEEALKRAGSGRLFLFIADDLAPVYMRVGQYEKAASFYGFKADPRNLSTYAAMAFVKTGRFAEARKSFREAQFLHYHPEYKPYMPGSATNKSMEATIFLGKGFTEYEFQKYGNAAWALSHAVQAAPRNPLVLYCYAQALTGLERYKEARRYFEAARRLDNGLIARRARTGLLHLDKIAA